MPPIPYPKGGNLEIDRLYFTVIDGVQYNIIKRAELADDGKYSVSWCETRLNGFVRLRATHKEFMDWLREKNLEQLERRRTNES